MKNIFVRASNSIPERKENPHGSGKHAARRAELRPESVRIEKSGMLRRLPNHPVSSRKNAESRGPHRPRAETFPGDAAAKASGLKLISPSFVAANEPSPGTSITHLFENVKSKFP